jgi:hypothetical protein
MLHSWILGCDKPVGWPARHLVDQFPVQGRLHPLRFQDVATNRLE